MALNPVDIATVSRLLDEALDLARGEREAWLSALPPEQQRHAPALREMLARQDTLDTATSLPRLHADEAVAHSGDLVGPYRLLREIGRGGMGSVWLAERADGSFKRQVALKLPRLAWGAGLAERMAREREIGAMLEHPNIARLYDAGVDDRGRPYLALEYIDGQPIDAWCEARKLSVRERLRLFVQVAKAVSYAHGRLVVHRDLKPSNVMVTTDGQAHLLDFGIAKLLHDAEPGASGLTQEQGRVLSPHYASPEQIAGEAITVQSDVYSLGVLLYELLTGSLPMEPKRQTAGAIEDAILQGDAPPASGRVKDSATARALRGELDSILTMAMKREPGHRYASADAFARDLERHLNGDTVAARPDSWWYRIRKSVRRHWGGVSAAAAMLVTVLVGAGVATVQAQRASAEAQRAQLVKEFVVDIFDTNGKAVGGLTQMPAHELLERGARTIDTRFAGQPLLQAELYGVVSKMYFNLSRFEQAVDFGTRQVELLASAGADSRLLAAATFSLGDGLVDLRRWSDAELRFRRAIVLAGNDADLLVRGRSQLAFVLSFGLGNRTAAGQELDAAESVMRAAKVAPIARANALLIRGGWLADQGFLDRALPLYEEAIRLAVAAEGPLSRTAMHARTTMASGLVFENRAEAAKPHLAAALAAMRALGGPGDVRAALEEARFASWMFPLRAVSFTESSSTLERSLSTLRSQSWPASPAIVAEVERRLGWIYRIWGDVSRGQVLTAKSTPVSLASEQGPRWHWNILFSVAQAAAWSGRASEAEAAGRERLAIGKTLSMGDDAADSYFTLAEVLLHDRRYAEAEAVLDELDATQKIVPADRLLKYQGSTDPDEQAVRLTLALERHDFAPVIAATEKDRPGDPPGLTELRRIARAAALCGLGRIEEALTTFEEWLPRLSADRYDASPLIAYWRARMGLCALQAGHKPQAREASALASAALAKQPEVSAHFKAPVLELARRLRGG